ncbi:glycoside hydrolase family 113 [Microvirga roseola]|uniref:glycoside hydrolase family 113 n=1 Tax=Microvirga roseola TaxID=2883126 RepID=UPI001E2A2099|nr:glycoside hydrolase TIM-barrel-like domain-containing protein [Microvirga roseola]
MPSLFDFQAESLPSWWDGNYRMPWTQANLDLIQGDGASQVVIVPTVYMDSLSSTRVYRDNSDPGGYNTDDAPRTESDGSIREAISQAKARGLEVIFKLHVNIQNADWNALIGPPNHPDGSPPTEAEWMEFGDAWFASYKESVLHYARLAKEQGVTAFAIGNECESMTHPRFTEHWKDIIKAIREEVGYTDKLTYAATWTEALHVGFWDALDYVGANPYISFTDSPNPTVQQLIDAWTKPSQFGHVSQPIVDRFGENISAIEELQRIAEQAGKKLIFTETGFRSLDGSNYDPWTWRSGRVDEVEQVRMFEAFYKIITDRANEGWVGGYWLWNYDAGQLPADPSPDDGYYTHGKLADDLVEQYFKNPTSIKGRNLVGTVAAEVILGGFNHDTLTGGAGADVFVYAGGDDADIVADFDASQGDRIRLNDTGAEDFDDLTITAIEGGYRIAFADGGSLTVLTAATPAAEWFVFNGQGDTGPSTSPSPGDDEITGTDRANTIRALEGSDTISGLGGNDRLYGDAGDDIVDGGAGNNGIYGGDRLYGGAGSDILLGGLGNDQVRGEEGDDMLYGDEGNDIVRGGNGYDLLDGGEGNDRLYGDADDDQITGGEGDDLLQGGAGDDMIEGENGSDKLYGGSGKDVVLGWFGDDQIWGGAGDDVLDPGAGNDRLWGGSGADRYVFNSDMGQDIVQDFKVYQNEMLLIRHNINHSGIVDFETLKPHMKQVGKNVVMDLGTGEWLKGDNPLTLLNVRLKDLKADHFYFYY